MGTRSFGLPGGWKGEHFGSEVGQVHRWKPGGRRDLGEGLGDSGREKGWADLVFIINHQNVYIRIEESWRTPSVTQAWGVCLL